MSTIITVVVREDRADFHGNTAHVSVRGDGGPEHFAAVVRLAMTNARAALPDVWRGSSPYPTATPVAA